jgi:hypothetical protein
MSNQVRVFSGRRTLLSTAVAAVLACYSGSAAAVQWRFDNGSQLIWNTSITVGASWSDFQPDALRRRGTK